MTQIFLRTVKTVSDIWPLFTCQIINIRFITEINKTRKGSEEWQTKTI